MSGVLDRRASGVLLHPTSLPGGPIGDLGPAAFAFVDWLADAGQSYWQILPLTAVDDGGSPYNGLSAVAGNPLLISLAGLVEEGLLALDAADADAVDTERVDFRAVAVWKGERLRQAHETFLRTRPARAEAGLRDYRAANAAWIEDYALFRALRDESGGAPWFEWEPGVRSREAASLERARERLGREVDRRVFEQFLFDRQWAALRAHAGSRGIRIIGDIPIFVAHDSADAWAHPDLFELDDTGRPLVVSGVPPDYFSETGQRWGNPLFRWDVLRERHYDWWVERFRRALSWVDVVRVDHFRGFESYWEIPAEEETAVNGRWRAGPGADLFDSLERQLGSLPIIAEDLGVITREVEILRDELDFPGMRVLQFGLDGDPENPHLPENYPPHSVVYTGTHDNDTILGWWAQASADEHVALEARTAVDPHEPEWSFNALVMRSAADLVILPVQDVLGLGSDARMNTPGTTSGNWAWRLLPGQLTGAARLRLLEETRKARRLPPAFRDPPSPR